jgi:hypothetical protein
VAAAEAFNIARVVRRTFGLISRNWAQFSILAALFSGLPYLLLLLAIPTIFPVVGGVASNSAPFVWFGLGAMYLLGAMVLQAALTRASVDELTGRRVSLSAALGAALGALLPMLGLLLFMTFLFVVAVFAWGIAAGIAALGANYAIMVVMLVGLTAAAVYLVVRWVAAVPVVVVERPGVIQSLRRSSALTEGHRWQIFGLVVLYAVALVVLQAVLRAVLPGAEYQPTRVISDAAWLISSGVVLVTQIATSMIVAVGIAAIYFELRQIKEGVGVEELAQVFA